MKVLSHLVTDQYFVTIVQVQVLSYLNLVRVTVRARLQLQKTKPQLMLVL